MTWGLLSHFCKELYTQALKGADTTAREALEVLWSCIYHVPTDVFPPNII